MKDIQTVTGALDPSLLGFTLMHEHLLISSWNNRITDPEWLPYEKALDFIARSSPMQRLPAWTA